MLGGPVCSHLFVDKVPFEFRFSPVVFLYVYKKKYIPFDANKIVGELRDRLVSTFNK